MKKIINLITVIFCIWFSSTAIAQSVFWSDSFEQSYVRTTSSDFLCGGTSATSYFTKTNSGAEISVAFGSYSAYHLANFWAGENVDFGSSCTNNSQSANQTITWSNINIAGQSSISFKGLFAANNAGLPTNWEGSAFGTLPQDYVIVEYRIDAGAWTQALAFYASSSTQSSSLSQDTNGDLIGDGLALTGAFSEFTANITGTGTNLSLRLSAHSDQLNEEFAVDNFRLLSPLTATQSQVNTFCNGACNGSAKVVASGGVAPYTYSWSPSGGSAATASGLCAGTYTCTITDNALSTITKSFTITQPSAIVVSASSQTNVSCNGGSNGAASINMPTGGEPGYTYDWTPGTPAGDGTRSVTGLSAGTWTCTVTDANSCTKTQTFTITQPSAIVVSADPQSSVYCYTNNNGAASINIPTGGTGPYTYNWTSNIDPTTFNVTRSVTGLRAGPVYTCTVMDSNGCTKSLDFIINTELSVSADTQTNVSCNGGNNGAAKVSGFGGARTAPEYGYYFNWTPGNPTGDGTRSVTGLSAGTWTCTVTDGNGCTKTQTFTITQPSAIAVSAASQTNVSCNGGSNGAASVNTSGGTPGYTYNWTPGNPTGDGTPSVTGLSAGTWTCTVTDINGCTKTQTFTITQPSAILLSAVSQTNVSCNGGSNGSASVTLSGGAGGYTYYWSPSGGTAATATGLSAGTWTCYVTDSEGCTKTVNFTVTQPSAIVVSAASQTNVSCNGGSNGAASINTPTGGTPGYTYNWSPGTPTGDGTPSVTGLSAGTWTCTVTDANSCTATKTFTITEPSPLEVSAASQTNEVCYRGYFGSASINIPTGGTAPYTYDWTPGNPTGDGTRSVNFLSAGTWTCTVTDNNGCTATLNFTITEPSPLQVSAASQTNVSCNGQNNGAASVNTTGGEPEYTYEWTPGTPAGDGTPSVSGLSAGRWTCYVTDSNGCYKTQEFYITVNDTQAPVISCQANITGVVATSAAGAIVNYTTPVGTDNCTGATTSRIAGLASGDTFPIGVTTVTHRVTDAAGLTADCSFTVTVVGVAPAITCPANISVNNTTGQCGAAVTFAATETVGIPASVITYSIASGSNFSVGTTQVTATATNAVGSSSCTFDVIVNDTEKPVITCPANISATSNIGCATAVEVGTATATDNCGVDHVSGVRSDALALNALYPEGVTTITWTATDIHGIDSTICEQTVTVTGQQAVASISSQTICSGLPMSNIAVSGGVLGTTYSWTRDNGANVTGIATSGSGDISGGVLTNTTNDPVTVTFTITPNYDGCAGKSVTAIVIVNPKAETPVISGNAPFCQGSSVTLDAGSGYASYSWSNGATTQTTAVSNATPVSVSVTNSFGCSATSLSVTPVVNSLSVAPTSITPSVAIATPGSNFTLSVNGGSLGTAANWKWYTTSCGGTLVGTGASISVSQMVNTTYYVRAEGTCNTTACASVTVNIQCGASVIISSVGTTTVCPGTVVTLTPVGALSTGAQWRWDDDCDAVPSTSDSSATYTTASSFTVTPTCTTTYYLQSVGGACGVTGCLSVTVNVIAKPATPGTIGGLAIVCPSTSGTYSIAAVANATSYTWTAPTNATMIVAANGLSAVLTYSSTFVSGTLSVKANNCAGSSTSKTLAITKTATPATPGTITGLASVCPSTSGAYSIATVANATTYTWIAPANATITAGQGTTSVTVSYASGFTSGTLSVKATGCGGTSVAKTLTVTKTTAPATPVTISGLATVCASTSGTYSIAAVANATSYTWTAPVNASITAGQGTTSVTVTYASGFTTGTLSVIATGCGGTSAAKTLAISKTAIPATPGAITGASPACAASTQTYSITAVPNATSYTWTLPTGMSYVANSSTTGTVIQVVLASTFSGGTLSVKATNCSGSSATVSKVLTASALPTSAGTITGPTTVCKRAKLLTYSVAAATGFTFNWSVPSGAVITAGAGTNSIKVTWGTVSGNVSVTKVNACGSSAASTLAVSSATCRDTQDVVVTLFKAVAYPNPFAENFMINVTSSSQEMVGLKVYDMIGRLIEQREVKVSDLENSTIGDRYPSGVYNILVTQGEEVKTVRVVKR